MTREQLKQRYPNASESFLKANANGIPTIMISSPPPTPKAHKYRAQPTVVDGIRFASKRESERYGILKALENAGKISQLKLQEVFPIVVNGVRVCKYIADFCYKGSNGQQIVEDVKGFRTPVYKLKKKLFEACYNLKITEV